MNWRWFRLSIPLILAVFFLVIVIYGDAAQKDEIVPAYGDALVVASIGDARTLVPILASDSASSDICGLIFNGLVKHDKNINIVGDLAEYWEIQEDGLVIVFHLRRGVRWHDGVPFTAKDVEFTYRKLIDLTVITYKAIWSIITGRLSVKESMTGPIGIFMITGKAASMGIIYLFHLKGHNNFINYVIRYIIIKH